jgi:hypothetical protein
MFEVKDSHFCFEDADFESRHQLFSNVVSNVGAGVHAVLAEKFASLEAHVSE